MFTYRSVQKESSLAPSGRHPYSVYGLPRALGFSRPISFQAKKLCDFWRTHFQLQATKSAEGSSPCLLIIYRKVKQKIFVIV